MRPVHRAVLAGVVLTAAFTACGGRFVQAGTHGRQEEFCALLRHVQAVEGAPAPADLSALARLAPAKATSEVAALAGAAAGAPAVEGLVRSHCQKWAAIPNTPVGRQLWWALRALNGEGEQLRPADVSDRFSGEFLEHLAPAPRVVDLFREAAAEHGPFRLVGYAQPPTPTTAVGLLRTRGGELAAIRIAVGPGGAHRIVSFELGDAPVTVVPTGDHSGLFDIGGRSIFVRCTGTGSPTVVLDGGTVADWFTVQNRIARRTQVCSYDRPNVPWGRSDPAPTPRTARLVADDLRGALAAAGVEGPFVLAAHSNSGLTAQLFASLHPSEVRGMVLIDAVHPEYRARRLALLRRLAPDLPPPPVLLPPAMDPEQYDVEASSAQVVAAGAAVPPSRMPLYVLSHGAPDPADLPPGSPDSADELLWRQLQDELASVVPGAWHQVVAGTGHDIPSEQPQAVVDAVNRVLDAVNAS